MSSNEKYSGLDELGEFDDLNDFDDDCKVIVMNDEDGIKREYMLIDSIEVDEINYLLVVEAEFIDAEEAEAVILKEIRQEGEDAIYEVLEQEAEFDKIAELFQNSNDDYEIEL